jgi:hydroxyacylglutathione hydrolase
MRSLEVFQFPYGSDNYGVLLHSQASGETACIDAGDAQAAIAALAVNDWELTHLFITHHHADHTAGLAALKSSTGCQVTGPRHQSQAIAGLDHKVGDGDRFEFACREVQVLHTPGHTMDMINFYLPEEQLVFTGDTLFALGCGRVFEGDASMMWDSLSRLMALPEETRVYCSHEYTKANARFALTIDRDNADLQARAKQVEALRSDNKPTIPSSIGLELATNPFLRTADPAIRHYLNMTDAGDAEVFAEIRRRKDNF